MLASIAPGHHPWAVGSTDGSVWNAMFVFNGFGKVGSTAPITKPGGPGPFRLLVATGWHYDELFGCMLVAAVAIGGAAVALTLWRRRHSGGEPAARVPRAFAICLAVWIACSLLAFDTMHTVHARYLEAMAPALAATIGYGAATLAGLTGRSARPSLVAIIAALGVICAYTFSFKPASLAAAAGALILSAIGAALIAQVPGPLQRGAKWLAAGMIVASALVFPIHETLSLVRSAANDSLGLATTAPENAVALSQYLRTADGGPEVRAGRRRSAVAGATRDPRCPSDPAADELRRPAVDERGRGPRSGARRGGPLRPGLAAAL